MRKPGSAGGPGTSPLPGQEVLHGVVTGNGHAGGFDTSVFGVFEAHVARCTIAGNDGGIGHQGVGGAYIQMRDTIAWRNTGFDVFDPGGACVGGPNLMGTVLFGTGAPPYLTANPRFWNLSSGDLQPLPDSPCIDAETPSELDPDGSRRDLGALPYDPSHAPAPAIDCTGRLNSQGCVPAIAWQGVASATAARPFPITCSNVLPGRRGLLFYGFAPAAVPFQGATYCIQQPTRRTGGQVSVGTVGVPCSGSSAFDFNARIQSGFDPGRAVYAQGWHVDPNDRAGFGPGLSNALLFGIAP